MNRSIILKQSWRLLRTCWAKILFWFFIKFRIKSLLGKIDRIFKTHSLWSGGLNLWPSCLSCDQSKIQYICFPFSIGKCLKFPVFAKKNLTKSVLQGTMYSVHFEKLKLCLNTYRQKQSRLRRFVTFETIRPYWWSERQKWRWWSPRRYGYSWNSR